jgi:hypothetical protein
MDVWEDFEGFVKLEEVERELLRAEFTNKTVIERERISVEKGAYLEMGSSTRSQRVKKLLWELHKVKATIACLYKQ